MKNKHIEIDIRLDRSAKYVESLARYNVLKAEFDSVERQKDEAIAGIGLLKDHKNDRIEQEAMALLSGSPGAETSTMRRDEMAKTIDELSHRLAVLRQALAMQRRIFESARSEVGNAIASDLLPQHKDNVKAIVVAAIQLSTALQAEAELRDTLTERGVPFGSVIRAMPLHGWNLFDNQSRLSRYLLECYEHGLIGAEDLPDIVRDRLPSKAKPIPKSIAQNAKREGWVLA